MTSRSIIENIKLTADEKKALKNSKDRLALLTALEPQTRLPADASYQCELWDKVCSTGAQFCETPTVENLRAHLAVLNEIDSLEKHKQVIRELGGRAVEQARAPLAAVHAGVLDRATASLDADVASKREPAQSAGLLAELEAGSAKVRAEIQAHRAAESPADWLADFGFTD